MAGVVAAVHDESVTRGLSDEADDVGHLGEHQRGEIVRELHDAGHMDRRHDEYVDWSARVQVVERDGGLAAIFLDPQKYPYLAVRVFLSSKLMTHLAKSQSQT